LPLKSRFGQRETSLVFFRQLCEICTVTFYEGLRVDATIWHNPSCGTSRKTLALLHDAPGVAVTIVDYLKTPPTRDTLAQLYADAGITPRQGLRTRGSPAEDLGLLDAGDDAILDAMVAHPILIERPLVRTDKGVRLCRPQDLVRDIL
jgi:arsenate reductase (glutaredoxin)